MTKDEALKRLHKLATDCDECAINNGCAKLALKAALEHAAPAAEPVRKFRHGDRVTKIQGSSWTGHVCGFYSTSLTPIGYDVESENEPGSVQLYPEAALKAAPKQGGDQ